MQNHFIKGLLIRKRTNIIGTKLLTKFYEDRTVNVASRKNALPVGSHISLRPCNLLTKFHKDWTINVASRVKNAPPLFHDDRKINVTSRVKNAPPHDIIGMNLLTEKCPPPGGHVF
ncbi:hypothetical protein DPMN_174495 [Dreissena polymorpha]|uniref:Uncharacterized protein n=1 Tax=Dreissena polymorpha TaxID=45954 RepID=A0A9D4E633_DREPO|nr:hypothetical protein DPMN_174495 [Dreissena polymorpha]